MLTLIISWIPPSFVTRWNFVGIIVLLSSVITIPSASLIVNTVSRMMEFPCFILVMLPSSTLRLVDVPIVWSFATMEMVSFPCDTESIKNKASALRLFVTENVLDGTKRKSDPERCTPTVCVAWPKDVVSVIFATNDPPEESVPVTSAFRPISVGLISNSVPVGIPMIVHVKPFKPDATPDRPLTASDPPLWSLGNVEWTAAINLIAPPLYVPSGAAETSLSWTGENVNDVAVGILLTVQIPFNCVAPVSVNPLMVTTSPFIRRTVDVDT